MFLIKYRPIKRVTDLQCSSFIKICDLMHTLKEFCYIITDTLKEFC